MLNRAVFFDRDGVVNVSPGDGYVVKVADFSLTPGIVAVLAECRRRGYRLVLVTSQQAVGKGLMTSEELATIHTHMQDLLAPHDAEFDLIMACPHLDGTCTCRKPSPEMVTQACHQLQIDPTNSLLVGDHDRDILMGQNAGLATTIRYASHHQPTVVADHSVADAEELLTLLQRILPS